MARRWWSSRRSRAALCDPLCQHSRIFRRGDDPAELRRPGSSGSTRVRRQRSRFRRIRGPGSTGCITCRLLSRNPGNGVSQRGRLVIFGRVCFSGFLPAVPPLLGSPQVSPLRRRRTTAMLRTYFWPGRCPPTRPRRWPGPSFRDLAGTAFPRPADCPPLERISGVKWKTPIHGRAWSSPSFGIVRCG